MGDIPETARETKHASIEHAAARLSHAVSDVEDFATVVREGPGLPPKSEIDKEPVPSLQATLDNTPGKLENMRERLLKALESLNASLF